MRSKQFGATAIEFALIFPLLFLVLDGVMEFSIVMYDKVILTNAAREAVRAGVVLRTPKLSNEEISAVAQSYCANYLLSFGDTHTANITVDQASAPAFQTSLGVTVTYTYRSLMMSSVLSALNMPIVLTSHATGMNE
jgi:Flp pilus assembly protein TadG